ncbi:MAG: type II toxin-antitoxin system RelE/ParE family toxin [Chitinophagaceae bacterium]|nr:type II toxin-antitoxin system RelE/ParE family toxin [Chitinophagaceae bacterium]
MIYQYSFFASAQKDYEESLNWYLQKSSAAADGFIKAVDFALIQICNYPDRYRNTYKHYYEIRLKKYPFALIYSIEKREELIIVWKVFHEKRDPGKKFTKLKKLR